MSKNVYMKLVFTIINNIRYSIPYLLLIGIYFFFVNLEARKNQFNNPNNIEIYENQKSDNHNKSKNDNNPITIRIPVIPYNK